MTANTEPMIFTLEEMYQYMSGRSARADGRRIEMGWSAAQTKGYVDAALSLTPVYRGAGSNVVATLVKAVAA